MGIFGKDQSCLIGGHILFKGMLARGYGFLLQMENGSLFLNTNTPGVKRNLSLVEFHEELRGCQVLCV